MNAIDLFAGAGGWDIALRELGVDPLGIEIDPAACATREAAGLRTINQADVSAMSPLAAPGCELLIASPPCPTFSSAGKGAGNRLREIIEQALRDQGAGKDTRALRVDEAYAVLEPLADLPDDTDAWPKASSARKRRQRAASPLDRNRLRRRFELRESRHREAEMTLLLVEPLRWALALEPRFLAWEQVPPVQPLWEICAEILRERGWSVLVAKYEAERYGVPQTRERAILMADREQAVHPPQPTHQRYVKGEPQRHEATLEGEVLPWVSMADALGWAAGGTLEHTMNDGSTGEYSERAAVEPAFTVAPNSGRWKFRNGNQENATERDAEEPAPTIHFGRCMNEVRWVYDRRQSEGEGRNVGGHGYKGQARDSGPAAEREPRSIEEPSYTIRAAGSGSHPSGVRWTEELAPCGCAIRVSLEEAAVLQSFPPDYPFQGTKGQRFLQVGNAVPPLLALRILEALLAPVLTQQYRQKAAA